MHMHVMQPLIIKLFLWEKALQTKHIYSTTLMAYGALCHADHERLYMDQAFNASH